MLQTHHIRCLDKPIGLFVIVNRCNGYRTKDFRLRIEEAHSTHRRVYLLYYIGGIVMFRAMYGLHALLHLNWHTTLLTATRYQAAACIEVKFTLPFIPRIVWGKHMLRRNTSDVAKFEKARCSPARLGGFLYKFDKTLPNEQPAGYCGQPEKKTGSPTPDALFFPIPVFSASQNGPVIHISTAYLTHCTSPVVLCLQIVGHTLPKQSVAWHWQDSNIIIAWSGTGLRCNGLAHGALGYLIANY